VVLSNITLNLKVAKLYWFQWKWRKERRNCKKCN